MVMNHCRYLNLPDDAGRPEYLTHHQILQNWLLRAQVPQMQQHQTLTDQELMLLVVTRRWLAPGVMLALLHLACLTKDRKSY